MDEMPGNPPGRADVPSARTPDVPRRFRFPTGAKPHSGGGYVEWRYGCYFARTDLTVLDLGERGTGEPEAWRGRTVEWLDLPPREAL